MERKAIEKLAQLIDQSAYQVFFGGAGVSTESGVPDFRGKDGLYTQNISGEEVLTNRFMHEHPEEFYQFNRDYFMLEGIQPNPCHKVLAALEREGKMEAVITQNIDNLHQLAGSKKVIELHGNTSKQYCEQCQRKFTLDEVKAMDLIPRCPDCGGYIRPDIVYYGESLNSRVIQEAVQAIHRADLLIIGGSSLTVYPAAGMIHYQKKSGKKVLINQTPTLSDDLAGIVIRDPIGRVFAELAEIMNLSYE